MPVDDEQVRTRIVVEIAKRDTPADKKMRALAVSRRAGDVRKTAVTVIDEQGITFELRIGVVESQPAVLIDVGDVDPHRAFLDAIFGKRVTGEHG